MQSPKRNPVKKDEFQEFNDKCVCQICTCGKHHCPPTHLKFNGETTYHHDFKKYNISAQSHLPCRLDVITRHYDPDSLKTSYEKDFHAYKIQPQSNPEKLEYVQSKLPFYDQTEYKNSYVPFNVQVQRPSTTMSGYDYKNKAKFDGTTTYNTQFSPKRIQKAPQSPLLYQRKIIPFVGQSMYHSEFKPYQTQITKPPLCHCKPQHLRQNKFMGESRYHEQFKPYEILKEHTCPINEMPVMPRSCSPGKTHLDYSAGKHRWE